MLCFKAFSLETVNSKKSEGLAAAKNRKIASQFKSIWSTSIFFALLMPVLLLAVLLESSWWSCIGVLPFNLASSNVRLLTDFSLEIKAMALMTAWPFSGSGWTEW
ncbi:hypothetical protein WICPIJ_002174 [Wickerhamomyces pijperi]|uniref:Uncharacterized protein n=1 Tax=Wickerhamomyces pijperi TaxID=599730 RepID=A0A9P8QC73_WICPI|nr:hypothetical protein WICPIJ_002174 [Wickerhamomyces pijperi]